MRFILLVVVLYCIGILLWVADAANARPAFPTTAQELAARVALPPSDHAPAEPQITVTCAWRLMAVLYIADRETLVPLQDLEIVNLAILPAPVPCPSEQEESK